MDVFMRTISKKKPIQLKNDRYGETFLKSQVVFAKIAREKIVYFSLCKCELYEADSGKSI